MRQAWRPKAKQAQLIRRAGLNSDNWLVRHEDKQYLHLVDRGLEQRQIVIIDKTTGEVIKKSALGCREQHQGKRKITKLL